MKAERRGPDVPIKERSLEIFGAEKKLDQLRDRERLFGGRLTLSDLRCFIAPLPMPYEAPDAPTPGMPLLIIENHDTWSSFCTWNRLSHAYAAVAYGGGGNSKSLQYDERWIDIMIDRTGATEARYFGDVDPTGILIGARASHRRRASGRSPLLPEIELYEWLFENGRRTALSGSRNIAHCRDWMPSIYDRCVALFAAGERLPQEGLGLRHLLEPTCGLIKGGAAHRAATAP